MAGLGICIYLDENVNLHVRDVLRQRGYDVTHALVEGNVQMPDEQHLRWATAHSRALVTHDFADFARLHSDFIQRHEQHEGIILVPVRPLSELVARLSNHLDSYTPAEQRGNLLWA
jgi:hypothetical protein